MKNLFFMARLDRALKQLARENQGKPISVMEDVVFKLMLSSDNDDSRDALRSLLSACTHREVSSVRILNSELLPLFLGGKLPRLDVHATFNNGEKAVLEMQTSKSNDDLKRRAEYNTALLFAGQESKGINYRDIKRVYQIFFLDCVLFPKSGKLTRRYYYKEEEENDRLSDGTEIIFYELPKLERRFRELSKENLSKENLTNEEKWCIFIKYQHEERARELINRLCREDEGIMKANKQVEKVSRSYIRFARKLAEAKDKTERYYEMARARKQATEEGHAEGLVKGHAEGLVKGREEKSMEIARKLIARGLSLEEISEDTGIPLKILKNFVIKIQH